MAEQIEKRHGRKNFSQFPLAWLAVSFIAGVLFENRLATRTDFLIIVFLATIAFVVLFLVRRKLQLATVFLLLTFTFLGMLLLKIENQKVSADRICQIYDSGAIDFQTPVELTGVLKNEPEQTPSGYFLTLETEKIFFKQNEHRTSGRVRLFLLLSAKSALDDFEKLELRYGARVRVATRLTREDQYRNLGGTPFREILKNKDLDATATVKSPFLIERLDDAAVFWPLALLYDWRANLIKQFEKHFSVSTAGVLAASLLNNRYFLDKQTAARFREGGTFHILVISGAHISFIGLLIAWISRRVTKNETVQFLATNSLLWAFTAAVGAEVSVTRAALMFTIFYAASLFYRKNIPLNSLGAAALIQLVWRPADLFDQSFQLTFVSVAAIVGFALPLLTKMQKIGAWQLSEKTPIPPVCEKWFKTLCETLFWSERDWLFAQEQSIWKAKLFKSALAQKIEKLHLQKIWQFVFSAIFVSTIVALCLLPLQIIYFHKFSPVALFLNVFVGVLIAIETFVGLAAVFVASLNETLAAPLVAWTEIFNFLLVHSADFFINSNLAAIHLPSYGPPLNFIYWLYYLPLLGSIVLANFWNPFEIQTFFSKSRLIGRRTLNYGFFAGYGLLIAVLILHPLSAATSRNRLRIDFLDVGQGDSALITTPNNTKLLVDGGGRRNFQTKILRGDGEAEIFEPDTRSVGEAVVSAFLWARGFDTIDYVLPTHADADHINGLNDVVQNFSVKTAFVGRTPPNNLEFQFFAETLENHNVPIVKISRGEVFNLDDVEFKILAPEFDANADAPSDNDHSIVLSISYGARKFLLTGDIEAPAEQKLLQQPETLVCDVVKVAHHGSKTSSTQNFVEATKAKFAVISVGRESPFGHPNKEVLERWNQAEAQILKTGESGTISFSTDGEDLQLETSVKN